MAEPIGLASGLLALATFAFQSSIAIRNTIHSFQSHPKRVRDLTEELDSLGEVLGALTETVGAAKDVDLSALSRPLLRCGKACEEFGQEVKKCTSRSGDGRMSVRDWAKLTYMGDDIDGFRRMLAGYKVTITIALTHANLRKSSATVEGLENYRNLIETATEDLQGHLTNIDEKLETIFAQTLKTSDSDATELRIIKEERLSTQKCLEICAQLSDHIDRIELTSQAGSSSPGAIDPESLPGKITTDSLRECRGSLTASVAKLEQHIRVLVDRLVTKSRTAMSSEEEAADLARLRDEWETTRQSVEICSKAEDHLKQNISIIENYATGDAVQFMVSTDGTIIHGKNRGLGWRTRQVGGHISDASVQQLSRDMSNVGNTNVRNNNSSPSGNGSSVPNETGDASEFGDRYGQGFTLATKPSGETAPSAGGSAEDRQLTPPKQ